MTVIADIAVEPDPAMRIAVMVPRSAQVTALRGSARIGRPIGRRGESEYLG